MQERKDITSTVVNEESESDYTQKLFAGKDSENWYYISVGGEHTLHIRRDEIKALAEYAGFVVSDARKEAMQ